MALKASITEDEYGDLSDDIKKEYEIVDDGSYRLQVTPVDGLTLENTTSLKATLSKERNEKKSLQSKLKKFAAIEDPEAATDALRRLSELDDKEKDVDSKIQKAKDKVTADYQSKLDGVIAENKTLDSQIT